MSHILCRPMMSLRFQKGNVSTIWKSWFCVSASFFDRGNTINTGVLVLYVWGKTAVDHMWFLVLTTIWIMFLVRFFSARLTWKLQVKTWVENPIYFNCCYKPNLLFFFHAVKLRSNIDHSVSEKVNYQNKEKVIVENLKWFQLLGTSY